MDTSKFSNEQMNSICTQLDSKDVAAPLDYTTSYDSIIWLIKKQPLKVQADVMSIINSSLFNYGAIPHPRAWAGHLIKSLVKHKLITIDETSIHPQVRSPAEQL